MFFMENFVDPGPIEALIWYLFSCETWRRATEELIDVILRYFIIVGSVTSIAFGYQSTSMYFS